eukprot:GFUD01018197.1.p1 GENE.GFUD01018197.1~~GFUD01018197.1.p1  ORF type:complete len:460 (+),score=85.88 GFUD01018197.1:170-1549(+)
MTSLDQQIVAVDTKFNKYRAPLNPHFRKTYLKRRMQLLSANKTSDSTSCPADCSCCSPTALSKEEVRSATNYLQLRTQLLRKHCRSQGISDLQSTKSFSFTTGETRSPSQASYPRIPKSLSVTFSSNSNLIPSEAYDFRGFHHLSDIHRAAVTHLMFAHNCANTLIASSLDGTLSVYKLESDPPSVSLTLQGHTKGVTDFDISTSNELVVSCSLDGTVCLWQLSDGKLLRQVTSACRQGLTSCRFLPGNNNMVVAGSTAGLVQIINISTGIFPVSGTSTVPGSVLCLSAGLQDSLVWAGTDRGTVLSFRVDTGVGKLAKGHRLVVAESGSQRVTSIASRPSPTTGQPMLLVSAGNNSLLLYTVTDSLGSLRLHRKFPVVHSDLTLRSTFAPLMSFRSGDCVVSASEDGAVYFFDVSKSSRACINKLQAHSCAAMAVAFNYSETFLATSDKSGLVIVWKR